MVGWLGMVMYKVYHDCDPITAKQVRTRDQMLPLHVLHVAGDYPGIPGLFMAGVFSGSLSSISSGLNSFAAVALRDFVSVKRLAKMSSLQQVVSLSLRISTRYSTHRHILDNCLVIKEESFSKSNSL